MSDENKRELIRLLQRDVNQKQDFYEQYCKECNPDDLISAEIDCVFLGKGNKRTL